MQLPLRSFGISRYLRTSASAPIVLVTSTASSPSCSWSNLKIDAVVVASGGSSDRAIPRTPLCWTQFSRPAQCDVRHSNVHVPLGEMRLEDQVLHHSGRRRRQPVGRSGHHKTCPATGSGIDSGDGRCIDTDISNHVGPEDCRISASRSVADHPTQNRSGALGVESVANPTDGGDQLG